ncbi:Smr/MutS family protein [Palleronia abyssalis]|uniref:Putative DNA endonuclease SmrA n=1 Tax=Palleronia abyssalis TaxID=1501240 RepID=A0A2R8BSX5_9RHOB|nr:Smr/MutS family protein [Palleronia abyssalis]SPJ23186.1 putative DNA endonuclease SmrA [Palleronia abyssalis]
MSRRRDLKPEERELWRRVQKTATPMHPRRQAKLPPALDPKPRSAPEQSKPGPLDLSGFDLGKNAPSPPTRNSAAPAPALRMDAKAHRKMSRGKMDVEGRIDLHGLTLAEAHPRLMSFIHSSHASGRRLILVITGKGRDGPDDGPIPERRGILRQQVPQWLSSGALRPIVLQITQAHRRHGGSGAFYVYLRRK